MQRKDVEALARYLRHEKQGVAADRVMALLDRAERAEAERDALQGQLNDLRNGWANSVKAHADALAERDALDAIASKLQHDHDMMALANGKLEAERDAAFAAGQEEMRNEAALVAVDERHLETARLIRALPIKPRP